jgi:hypothetical protein
MTTYTVLINGEEHGTIEAPSYQAARKLARALFRRSCDIIG